MSNQLDRAKDEIHLAWLRLRTKGKTASAIAAAYGVKPERVRVVTGRILDADAKESGELVAPRYWRAA